jgi:hypothetical protein
MNYGHDGSLIVHICAKEEGLVMTQCWDKPLETKLHSEEAKSVRNLVINAYSFLLTRW